MQRGTANCTTLKEELVHLDSALQANGYSAKEVRRALHTFRRPTQQSTEERLGTAFLPYFRGITDMIGKLLSKQRIRIIYKPTHQIKNLLRSVKDPRDALSSAGVYRVPCSCGSVYIGTTLRSVSTRINEHKRNCRLGQTEKSAIAEHAESSGEHRINFEGTEVLSTTVHYHTRLHREAIEIFKHRANFNRKEEGLKINGTWFPVLRETSVKPYRRIAANQEASSSPPSSQPSQLSN